MRQSRREPCAPPGFQSDQWAEGPHATRLREDPIPGLSKRSVAEDLVTPAPEFVTYTLATSQNSRVWSFWAPEARDSALRSCVTERWSDWRTP